MLGRIRGSLKNNWVLPNWVGLTRTDYVITVSCYSKLQMDLNSHRLLFGLSHHDAFDLRHFVISELQTNALLVKSFVCTVIRENSS